MVLSWIYLCYLVQCRRYVSWRDIGVIGLLLIIRRLFLEVEITVYMDAGVVQVSTVDILHINPSFT